MQWSEYSNIYSIILYARCDSAGKLLFIFIQTGYLSFAIATPGTLRIFLHKSLKGMQRFFNFTLNIESKYLKTNQQKTKQPPSVYFIKLGFIILEQETYSAYLFTQFFSCIDFGFYCFVKFIEEVWLFLLNCEKFTSRHKRH